VAVDSGAANSKLYLLPVANVTASSCSVAPGSTTTLAYLVSLPDTAKLVAPTGHPKPLSTASEAVDTALQLTSGLPSAYFPAVHAESVYSATAGVTPVRTMRA